MTYTRRTVTISHDLGLGRFWYVAFIVTGVQPAIAMTSALFCLTVLADNVLECFAKVNAEIAMFQ